MNEVQKFKVGDLVQEGLDSDTPPSGERVYGRVIDVVFDSPDSDEPMVAVANRLYGTDKYETVNIYSQDGSSTYEKLVGRYDSSRHLHLRSEVSTD